MKHLIYIFVPVLLSLAVFESVYAGFGITPPYVRNERLTKGSEFTQEIILVRGDPVEDLKAEITINVPGIEDWFTIDRGTEFILPKGQSQVPMRVTVNVPDNAPYESYKGNIRVRTVSPDLSSGVSIALGAQIDVNIRVVDKILDFDVRRVQLAETEQPRKLWWLDFPGKIKFTMTLNNTGNAPVAPSRVTFDIYDKRGSTLLESIENTNAIEKITPFETKPVSAFLPTHLPPGAYLVKYSIYLENEVKRQGELTLSVLPEGTIDGYQGYGFMGLSLGDKLSIIIPPILLLLALVAAVIVSLRLKNRAARKKAKRHAPPAHDTHEHAEVAPEEQPVYQPEPAPRTVRRTIAPPSRRAPIRRQAPPPPQSAPPRRTGRPQPDGGVVDLSRRRRE